MDGGLKGRKKYYLIFFSIHEVAKEKNPSVLCNKIVCLVII